MIYFIVGDGIPFQLKYQEILKEIQNKEGLPVNYFDFSQDETESFLERVAQNSMFSPKELFVIKRFESVKGIDKFIKILEKINFSQKELIFLYEEFFDDFGRREDEKDKASQDKKKKMLEQMEGVGKVYTSRVENMKKMGLNYVVDNLKVSEKEAEELLQYVGEDFYNLRNEVEKILLFLGGEPYSFSKVSNIITLNKEGSLKKSVELFLTEKKTEKLLEILEKDKEYIAFIYSVFEELLVYYKLTLLEKEKKIRFEMSYNDFKSVYDNVNELFLNDKTSRPQHAYAVFTKLKNAKNFKSEFLIKKLKELSSIDYGIKSGEMDPGLFISLYIMGFYNNN